MKNIFLIFFFSKRIVIDIIIGLRVAQTGSLPQIAQMALRIISLKQKISENLGMFPF
jgi:hypothetical protein